MTEFCHWHRASAWLECGEVYASRKGSSFFSFSEETDYMVPVCLPKVPGLAFSQPMTAIKGNPRKP